MALTPFSQLTPDQIGYAESSQWKELLRQSLADLRVSIPAIVESFDSSDQTVTVNVALLESLQTPVGLQSFKIPSIGKVPVCFQSAGGFSLTLPIKAGDEGMLVFCDMCIDLWWTRGGVQEQFERRRHDLSDCGFFPSGRSLPRALANYSTDSAQIRLDDGSAYIELTASGGVNILAPGGVNINGTVLIQKTLEVEQLVTIDDGMDVTGTVVGEGGTLTVNGAVVASGEVTGNGIALSTHVHSGVQGGTDDTGPPV